MEYYKNLSLEDLFYINDDGVVCCEEWRDIPDYVGKYKGSTLGRLKTTKRSFVRKNGSIISVKERIRRQTNQDGYLKVKLINSTFLVHRLIGVTFIENPNNLPEINHKFGVTNDNRVSQLEWSNRSENCKHAYDIGLNPHKTGENNIKCKLNNNTVIAIRRLHRTNPNISITNLSKKLNVGYNSISRIIQRISWKHI